MSIKDPIEVIIGRVVDVMPADEPPHETTIPIAKDDKQDWHESDIDWCQITEN